LKSAAKYCGTFFLSLHKIYIMKLKALMALNHKGKSYEAGDMIDVPEDKVEVFVSKGWAAKEAKVKKETKELKVSKETKEDASN
jgi:hypothetical protein